MGSEVPVAQVEAAMRDVCADLIMPRFQQLEENEIFEKGPGDLVTVADRESELALAQRLRIIDPTAGVVGEEAVAADPDVLSLAGGPGRVWIIDPIDGTGSFVRGKPRFAVMVALVENGATIGGWIWQPVDAAMYSATASGGAAINGKAIAIPSGGQESLDFGQMTGDVRTSFFDLSTKTDVENRISQARSRPNVRVNKGGACGYVYPDLVSGRLDYAVFSRQYPWDHAPGSLILEQAGGAVRDLDGEKYDPTRTTFGLLATAREQEWDNVHAQLFG